LFPELVQSKDDYQIRKCPNDQQQIRQFRPKANEVREMGDPEQAKRGADVQCNHALFGAVSYDSESYYHDAQNEIHCRYYVQD
jgi:hypothetical protein